MRWPWEWGRRSADTAGAGGAGDPATPSRTQPPAAPGAAATRNDWAYLPPVQRSLDDHGPSVAPPDVFRAGLTTHRNPSLLAPLGHLVDPDGPSGVVGGLAGAAPGEPVSYGSGIELRVPEPAVKQAARPSVQRRVEPMAVEGPVTEAPVADPPVADDDHDHHEPPTAPVLGEAQLTEAVAATAGSDPAASAEAGHHDQQPLQVARDVDRSPSGSVAAHPIALQRLADEPPTEPKSAAPAAAPSTMSIASPGPVTSAAPTVGEAVPLDIDRRMPDPAGSQTVPAPSAPTAAAAVPVQRQVSGGPVTTRSVPPEPSASRASARSEPESIPLTVSRLATRSDSAVTTNRVVESLASSNGGTAPDPVSAPSDVPASQPPPDAPEESPASRAEIAPADPPFGADRAVTHETADSSPIDEPTVARLLSDRPVLDERSSHDQAAESNVEIGGPAVSGGTFPVPGGPGGLGAGPASAVTNTAVQRQLDAPTADPVRPTIAGEPQIASADAAHPIPGEMAAAAPAMSPISAERPIAGAEYPPMIQRRVASSSPISAADEAPLSGFAAAISALQHDPDEVRSPAPDTLAAPSGDGAASAAPGVAGLVVARQVVESAPPGPPSAHVDAIPAGATELRSIGAPVSAPPPLVVARRIAPDASGALPSADVRLSLPAPSPVVQRRLLSDQPAPTGLPAAAPGIPAPTMAAPAGAPVQRIRYEDIPSAAQRLAMPTAASLADVPDRGVVPEPDAAPMPSPSTPSVPIGGSPTPWVSRAAQPIPPVPLAPVQRRSAAEAMPEPIAAMHGQASMSPAAEPVRPMPSTPPSTAPLRTAPSSPAPPRLGPFVQRSTDRRPSSSRGFAPSSDAVAAGPSATSTRTVGLAEMFALVSGGGDPGEADGSVVQRSVAGTPPAATEVQLAPSDAPATSSAPAPAGGSAAAAGGAPASGNNIEEMALRLYEPLTARLRAELWQDRERAGLLTDLRP